MRYVVTIILAVLFLSNCCRAQNEIVDLLLSQGVSTGPGKAVRLPPPTLSDGLTAADQRRSIEAVAEGRHSWDALTRRTNVAPFVLKISHDAEGSQIVGKRVDVWFIAYGNLSKLASDDFINSRLTPSPSDVDAHRDNFAKVLGEADLAPRGLAAPVRPEDPRYLSIRFDLLERVQLSATTRNVKTVNAKSLLVGSMLDSRFATDADYPNSWRSIDRDESGRRILGAPQAYSGFGAYAKATQLIEPRGAFLIEYHIAFSEPQGWFHGTNLLRSKLPIAAQAAVRDFRRELGKRE